MQTLTFRSCQLADCGRLRIVALNPVPLPTKVAGTGGGPRAMPAEPLDTSTRSRLPPNSYPSRPLQASLASLHAVRHDLALLCQFESI